MLSSAPSPLPGAARVFTETASGSRWKRPELERLLDQLRPGDVIVVWKLDRLTRSLADLLRIRETIQKAGGRLPEPHRGDRHHHARRPA